ncbi:universal stress protein [Nocardioides sp.]|uniref:universal stress protein n=1 Tax=Nocardioides sp. TaxID=35761 RepID=UPI003D0C098C
MNANARPKDWDDEVVLPDVSTPKRVLIAFDGSHNSERALAWGAYVGARAEMEIVVVVAYEQPMTMRGRGAVYVEEVRDELETEALALATEAVELLKGRNLNARGVVVKGEIAGAILDVVEQQDCELVIIGRQGISSELGGATSAMDRVRNMLQGGISHKVGRHCTVPVLMVP